MRRVGIAGFIHESNSFLSGITTRENFEQTTFLRGRPLIDHWRGVSHEIGGFIEGTERAGLMPVPIFGTYAIPSGIIRADDFDSLLQEMISELQQCLPLDGILLALHGAAVAENYPDADGEIVRRVRQIVGSNFPIVLTLDLHANVSPQMIAATNATAIYRSNPHIDQHERGLEAADIMGRILGGEICPVQALECPPLLINISRQYTQQSPARELYEDAREVMTWPGIISASVAMGFYYSDVEKMGASFLAVANRDREIARKAAAWMARRAWERREKFVGDLLPYAEAVHRALQSPHAPIALFDIGDNVGGGSPGDSTILLEEILRQRGRNALVVLFDPEASAQCVEAGVRRRVELTVGGKTDSCHGVPIRIAGNVRLISDGIFVESEVRHGGWSTNDQGLTAVIETEQENTIVVTSYRMPPFSLEQLLSLGIKPQQKKVLIVKGVVGPRAAYEPIAAEILLVDTPGSTAADPHCFTYHHRRRPLYPLELNADYTT